MQLAKVIIFCFLTLSLANITYGQGRLGAESESGGLEREITERAPLIEISRLESKDPLYSIELRDASLDDFFRLLAHDYDINVLVDDRVDGLITASFTNISLEAALDSIAEMHGLIIEKNKEVMVVKPNLITKTIIFKHVDADLFLKGYSITSLGSQSSSTTGSSRGYSGSTTGSSRGYSGSTTGSSGGYSGSTTAGSVVRPKTVFDLLSDIGQILLGKQRNLIMVIDYPKNVEKVENFAKAVDGKMTSRVFKLKYISAKELALEVKSDTDGDDDWELDVGTGSSNSRYNND